MTPSASDLSDLGSLSDSEWFEITSSSHGSQSDSDDEDNIPRPAALQTPDGLHLSLAGDADWQGLSDEHVAHPSIPEGVQSLEESPDITNSLDPAPSLVQASWETLQGAPGSSDVNVAYHSPSPEGFKLEFPDPLSSSSDDMHGSSMASTGTWTQSELRDPEDVAESPAADAPQPADLLIIVLGHRPSLLRTQRVVNMLVEAVGDALGAHHLTHHNHAISCEPFLSHAAPLFGTHDIAYGKQHTYRIVASDGVDADKVIARHVASLKSILTALSYPSKGPSRSRAPLASTCVLLAHAHHALPAHARCPPTRHQVPSPHSLEQQHELAAEPPRAGAHLVWGRRVLQLPVLSRIVHTHQLARDERP